MLTSFADLLTDRPTGRAVGAFTAYDFEGAIGAFRAASASSAGIIILLASRSYADRDGPLLLAALLAAAERSEARVCVQLDHCSDLAMIESALAAGVGAVMADGAALDYEDNVRFVQRAVDLARRAGAGIEAELGAIAGDEDVAQAVASGALTDPGQAADFVARTGADCLAVSIGNVHGNYREPPDLELSRLAEIHSRVNVPLSLHGASGLPDQMVRRAIDHGVAKINVNTELRGAYLAATEQLLPEVIAGSRLAALHGAQVTAVEETITAKLLVFDTRGSA